MMNPIDYAAYVIRQGGVVAYPTEYCFGLGCDPFNAAAVRRILKIKRRVFHKGLIVVADTQSRLKHIVDYVPNDMKSQIEASWPGPNTWLLPARKRVSIWVRGQHELVAVRVSANRTIMALCKSAGMPIISTSANRAGKAPLRFYWQVQRQFVNEVDYVVPAKVGNAQAPSTIRHGISGDIIRGA